MLISVIILQMVYRILTNSKTLELFSIADETSFEVMNKKMKFFITFIMAAGLLVVVVGLFGEYFFRTLSIMDKGTSQYKYFIASSIQVFIPIVLATITAVICIRYYAFFALSESQRNLEMINLLPGGVVCLDANAENNEVLVHYASDGVMGVFGIDDEDGINIIGKNALDYCHPEDVYKLVHFIKTFDLNSPEFELVYRVYNRKKGYIWVSLRGALAKKIGNNIRVYAMFLDIDDQVKHNNELKQKYMEGQMVNDVIANNAICSFYLNLTKNECKLETNQYGDEMEWAKDISNLDTLLKKASERNTNMDSLLGYQKLFNREHLTSNFALGKTSYIYEHNFMITDRVIKWVETRVALMTNPETNDIEGYMYTLDIDEHKNTQIITQRVLSGEYEYVELINIIDDSLTMYISRPFDDYGVDTKKLTYSKLLENHMSRIVVESERSYIKAKMSVATIVRELENRRLYTCAFTINTDDGQRRKLFQYQYLDKFRKNIIMTQSDITEVYEEDQRKADILRNALKAAEEANSAKNDFFSRISHDLRTPLNAVITLSNLAVNENDVIKLQEYMSKIAVSGEYLLALTNDIIDIAQIENDMVRVKLAPGTLSSCMDDVFNIIKPQCEAKNLELTYTPGSFVDTPVLIDISRVRQVLINLLSNAIKFTPENGKIWLTIEQQRTKDAMIINRIHVRDNGIGMSKEFCETAFDPFSGAYAYDRSNGGGTGLGLPIVKKLINMMGGVISLSSEENIGTEFVVEIAFRESLQDSVDVDEIATPDYNFTGKTFLLVEDNVINTEIAIILLTKAGANVEAVDNGLKAVLRMQDDDAEYKFDAVLMDIQMPVLDGLKAAKAIRNIRVKLAPGTLSSCMDDVFNIIKPQCEAKNLELTYTPGSFVDTPVLIDISRVRQVLINLLSNAIKFTPENGKIWLTIEQQRTKDAMIINRIHVRDNGIGMSKEFCETAFDPFSGAYAYDRSNGGGTGLGLPIVKKLINMMGGVISLSSEENIGTEFVVEIAFRESLQDSVDVDEIATPDYNFTGKTFLLVEDNVINTEIAIILLTKAGANVEAVDNGLKAVLRMQDDDAEYKFDAVLMDIQMPVLDGLKAAKAIRNINTDYTTHVPIIAMTANAFDSDVQKSLEEGMNAHISKPIDPKKLFAILDEEIKNAKYEGVI